MPEMHFLQDAFAAIIGVGAPTRAARPSTSMADLHGLASEALATMDVEQKAEALDRLWSVLTKTMMGAGRRFVVTPVPTPHTNGTDSRGAYSPPTFVEPAPLFSRGPSAMRPIDFGWGLDNPVSPVMHRYLSASVQSHDALPVTTTTSIHSITSNDGNKLINQYELIDTLGKGTSGKVKLAFDTHRNTTVAIKILRRDRFRSVERQQQLQREIAVMKRLRHKNLVSLYEVIDDLDSDKMYLVMQYVDDGVLVTVDPESLRCEPLEPAVAADAARQLAAGLAYLHSHRIVHRDIKPENILKSRGGTVFLCDFGVSEEFDGNTEMVSGWQGSPLFMAPEVHALRSSSNAVDGYAADVYSLGVTFALMFTGRFPSLAGDDSFAELDGAWGQLLRGMLHKDPARRPPAEEVRRKSKLASQLPPIRPHVGRVPSTDSYGASSAPSDEVASIVSMRTTGLETPPTPVLVSVRRPHAPIMMRTSPRGSMRPPRVLSVITEEPLAPRPPPRAPRDTMDSFSQR